VRDPLVVNVPGYTNSGPLHWQTLWEQRDPQRFIRVEQEDWDNPDPQKWVAALNLVVEQNTALPLILVGHSLGAVTIAVWAGQRQGNMPDHVRGALLVAPCDTERPDALEVLRRFAPMPRAKLDVPATLVASDDDPYISSARAAEFAERWGADFELLRNAGHINSASGYGPFPEGEKSLEQLAQSQR
jgi:uncharacterized protein